MPQDSWRVFILNPSLLAATAEFEKQNQGSRLSPAGRGTDFDVGDVGKKQTFFPMISRLSGSVLNSKRPSNVNGTSAADAAAQ
jgi:hypothetical protein